MNQFANAKVCQDRTAGFTGLARDPGQADSPNGILAKSKQIYAWLSFANEKLDRIAAKLNGPQPVSGQVNGTDAPPVAEDVGNLTGLSMIAAEELLHRLEAIDLMLGE